MGHDQEAAETVTCPSCGFRFAPPGQEPVRATESVDTADAADTAVRTSEALSDSVKSSFVAALKKDSPTDIAAGMRRLSQWAASGHYPTGTSYDDLKWFYNQCAKELKSRDKNSKAGGNFPARKSGS